MEAPGERPPIPEQPPKVTEDKQLENVQEPTTSNRISRWFKATKIGGSIVSGWGRISFATQAFLDGTKGPTSMRPVPKEGTLKTMAAAFKAGLIPTKAGIPKPDIGKPDAVYDIGDAKATPEAAKIADNCFRRIGREFTRYLEVHVRYTHSQDKFDKDTVVPLELTVIDHQQLLQKIEEKIFILQSMQKELSASDVDANKVRKLVEKTPRDFAFPGIVSGLNELAAKMESAALQPITAEAEIPQVKAYKEKLLNVLQESLELLEPDRKELTEKTPTARPTMQRYMEVMGFSAEPKAKPEGLLASIMQPKPKDLSQQFASMMHKELKGGTCLGQSLALAARVIEQPATSLKTILNGMTVSKKETADNALYLQMCEIMRPNLETLRNCYYQIDLMRNMDVDQLIDAAGAFLVGDPEEAKAKGKEFVFQSICDEFINQHHSLPKEARVHAKEIYRTEEASFEAERHKIDTLLELDVKWFSEQSTFGLERSKVTSPWSERIRLKHEEGKWKGIVEKPKYDTDARDPSLSHLDLKRTACEAGTDPRVAIHDQLSELQGPAVFIVSGNKKEGGHAYLIKVTPQNKNEPFALYDIYSAGLYTPKAKEAGATPTMKDFQELVDNHITHCMQEWLPATGDSVVNWDILRRDIRRDI